MGLSLVIDGTSVATPPGSYQYVRVNLWLVTSDPVDKQGKAAADAWTWGSNQGARTLDKDSYNSVGVYNEGPDDTCNVYLPVHSWKDLPASGLALTGNLAEVLYHEGFHCVQNFMIGKESVEAMDRSPSWITEGSAAWVGADLAGQNSRSSWWTDWLVQTGRSLAARDYDAIGFYSALAQAGTDPWTRFADVFDANAGSTKLDSDASFSTFTSGTPTLADVWSPTYFRHPDWGSDWEPQGLGVSADHPPVGTIVPSTTPQTFDASALAVALRQIEKPSAKKVVVVSSGGPVRIRDDGTIEQVGFTRGAFCFSDDQCKPCPEANQQSNNARQATAPLRIGVTGMSGGDQVTVVLADRDKHCKDPEPDQWGRAVSPPPGGGGTSQEPPTPSPPCTTSCASSDGDPHLVTVDGFRYDFQAAGEFRALAAGDGFEVQVRQEMFGDHSNISANTAVAMSVMGDHVGVYMASGEPEVHLDGAVAHIDGTTKLAHGGTVSLDSGSVAVAWPDGSTVWAVPSRGGSTYGLHVIVSLDASRKAQTTGLLASAPGGRLTARDGTQVTYAAPQPGSQAYTDLFRTFGDSWRVSAAESLFDYPDKQHDEFDLRQFPDTATSLDTLSADDLARGRAACAGVRDPQRRDECTFDVGLTGETALADSYDVIEAVVAPAGVLVVGSTSPTRTVQSETADRYRLVITQPGTVYLRHGDVSDATGTVVSTLTDAGGATLATLPLDEDYGPFQVTPGVYTLSVEAPKDATATYSYSLLSVPPDQTFAISIGDTVDASTGTGAGNIESWGAKDVYSFSASAGDDLAVVGQDCTDATSILRWTLYLGDEEQTEGALSCGPSSDTVQITQDGSYRIEVTAAVTGITYGDFELPEGVGYDGRYGFQLQRR